MLWLKYLPLVFEKMKLGQRLADHIGNFFAILNPEFELPFMYRKGVKERVSYPLLSCL